MWRCNDCAAQPAIVRTLCIDLFEVSPLRWQTYCALKKWISDPTQYSYTNRTQSDVIKNKTLSESVQNCPHTQAHRHTDTQMVCHNTIQIARCPEKNAICRCFAECSKKSSMKIEIIAQKEVGGELNDIDNRTHKPYMWHAFYWSCQFDGITNRQIESWGCTQIRPTVARHGAYCLCHSPGYWCSNFLACTVALSHIVESVQVMPLLCAANRGRFQQVLLRASGSPAYKPSGSRRMRAMASRTIYGRYEDKRSDERHCRALRRALFIAC